MLSLPKLLTYLGAIPFAFFAILSVLHYYELSFIEAEKVILLQLCYGSMIVSFLAGTYWFSSINKQNYKQMVFLMMPTILSLILVCAYILSPAAYILLPLILLFICFFFFEKRHLVNDVSYKEYLPLRRNVTVLVCLFLIISFLCSLESI